MHISKLAAIVMVFLVCIGCTDAPQNTDKEPPVRPAKIFIAQRPEAAVIRVFPGTVEAAEKSELSFRVGGQLQTLQAKPGMSFTKGDILAQLDDTEYVNILADRQAKYDLAASQFRKIEELFEEKFVSPTEVDEARASLEAAKSALETAKNNLKYTDLLAPFDGVIARVDMENFQSIREDQAIIQYHNSDNLDIRYSIPESLLGNIKRIDDPSTICAQVRFNAHPSETYKACFKEFESVPDSLTRSYSVVHSMQQTTSFPVLPGMAASVELNLTGMLLDSGETSVLVPIEAVLQRDGQTRVWRVQENGEVTGVTVVTGVVSNGYIFISEGVEPGDAIVAAGVSYIQEGMKVKPLTKERGL